MTGVAALAICAAFTSCSKGEELYDQGAIDQMATESITKTYNDAFIKVFGQPSPNQDWGFGSANTRAKINVNGNQWEECPELGSTEDADVTRYVRSLTPATRMSNPENMQNYFVTQVHCGTDTYTDLDNHSGIKGSNQMNHLMIAMQNTATLNQSTGALSGDWEHINNFNRGDDTDWKGNTLVTEGGTFDFAYLGSNDAKYHNRWIAVDGANVSKTGGGNYAGYWYICFDFEATNDYVQTVFEISQPGNNPGETFTDNVTVNGAWTVESAAAAGLEVEARGKNVTVTTNNARVTQYVQGNKVVIGDNDYTDWIVRLVKAQPKTGHNYTICVIGEDLTVGGTDAEDAGADFDFNDVVFDVALETNATWVRLKAAGGTLPLTIDGVEVHGKFGVDTNVMVNTGAGPEKAWVEFQLPNIYTDAKAIPVKVTKGGRQVELKAVQGEPASKIGVKTSYVWCRERVGVVEQYPNFSKWVTSMYPGTIEWY